MPGLLFFLKKNPSKERVVEQETKHAKLFMAITDNSLEGVRHCLQEGADPNRAVLNSSIGTTLLQYAIHKVKELEYAYSDITDVRIVELLLLEGASPKLLDHLKRDAFFYASPTYETQGIDIERAKKTSTVLNALLKQAYPQITAQNIKEISKILTRTKNSSLNKLCADTLQHIVSFLFVDQEKTNIFLKQLKKRITIKP